MAAGHKTGGRQKGTPNKRTVASQEAAATMAEKINSALGLDAFDGDAHGLLIAVYKNTLLPIDLRVEAAGKALPYEKPRLASVDVGSKDGQPLVVKIVRFGDHAPE